MIALQSRGRVSFVTVAAKVVTTVTHAKHCFHYRSQIYSAGVYVAGVYVAIGMVRFTITVAAKVVTTVTVTHVCSCVHALITHAKHNLHFIIIIPPKYNHISIYSAETELRQGQG